MFNLKPVVNVRVTCHGRWCSVRSADFGCANGDLPHSVCIHTDPTHMICRMPFRRRMQQQQQVLLRSLTLKQHATCVSSSSSAMQRGEQQRLSCHGRRCPSLSRERRVTHHSAHRQVVPSRQSVKIKRGPGGSWGYFTNLKHPAGQSAVLQQLLIRRRAWRVTHDSAHLQVVRSRQSVKIERQVLTFLEESSWPAS
jgi:hypothetical protein